MFTFGDGLGGSYSDIILTVQALGGSKVANVQRYDTYAFIGRKG
jgi:hypothetical protein